MADDAELRYHARQGIERHPYFRAVLGQFSDPEQAYITMATDGVKGFSETKLVQAVMATYDAVCAHPNGRVEVEKLNKELAFPEPPPIRSKADVKRHMKDVHRYLVRRLIRLNKIKAELDIR